MERQPQVCVGVHDTFYAMTPTHTVQLERAVTTVGSAPGVDIRLAGGDVAPLHAELVLRGSLLYVADLGLSRSGTVVGMNRVTQRLLDRGDVIFFGGASVTIGASGPHRYVDADKPVRVPDAPTGRAAHVLATLARAESMTNARARGAVIRSAAATLGISTSAVRQHVKRVASALGVPAGHDLTARTLQAARRSGWVDP